MSTCGAAGAWGWGGGDGGVTARLWYERGRRSSLLLDEIVSMVSDLNTGKVKCSISSSNRLRNYKEGKKNTEK